MAKFADRSKDAKKHREHIKRCSNTRSHKGKRGFVGGLVGCVIGFAVGGPPGALAGMAIGASVGVIDSKRKQGNYDKSARYLRANDPQSYNLLTRERNALNKQEKQERKDLIKAARGKPSISKRGILGGLLGAAIGFLVGGPIGAVIGATSGASMGIIQGSAKQSSYNNSMKRLAGDNPEAYNDLRKKGSKKANAEPNQRNQHQQQPSHGQSAGQDRAYSNNDTQRVAQRHQQREPARLPANRQASDNGRGKQISNSEGGGQRPQGGSGKDSRKLLQNSQDKLTAKERKQMQQEQKNGKAARYG